VLHGYSYQITTAVSIKAKMLNNAVFAAKEAQLCHAKQFPFKQY